MKIFSGNAHVYGDDIDTDRIIAGKYTKTLDSDRLSAHLLEDLDPDFVRRVRPGDILVAGKNFGCGSSREQAPLAIRNAGIAAVVANSFARLFFRNAINIGLPALEVGGHQIKTGAVLEVDPESGRVVDRTDGRRYRTTPLPPLMGRILRDGGLATHLRKHGRYVL